MSERKRLETLYRVMYESLTPGMMRRVPLSTKRRIAVHLGYRLVRDLSADQFMFSLLQVKREELAPMSIEMFDSSVSGYSIRPFFTLRFWRKSLVRIWRGETHTPEQKKLLGKLTDKAKVKFPGFGAPAELDITTRRRLP